MFRHVGACPECGAGLRWVAMPSRPDGGERDWALEHGEDRLGMSPFSVVLEDARRLDMERRWPAEWHARATREDGA